MPWRKTLLIYFVLVAVIYGALLIPWPGLMTGYRMAVTGVSNIFLGRVGEARMKFEPMSTPTRDKDIDVHVQHMSRGLRAKTMVNAGRTYLPVSLAVALVAAAPVPWRRKIIALVLAVALMGAYVQFLIWLRLMTGLLTQPQFQAVQISETTLRFLKTLEVLVKSPVLPYIVALVVFGLVTFRRDDLVRIAGQPAVAVPAKR